MKLHHTLLAAATLFACVAVQAQSVSVSANHTDLIVGDSFTVDFKASGFPDKIFGGGYNLAFDPAILKLDAITFPASWEFLTSPGVPGATAGTVDDIFFNTFAAPIKGDFLTASAKFTGIGVGTSQITLSESGSFPFGNELALAVAVTYVNGSATVAAVPEPGSLALVLGGLACVGWMSTRRNKTA